MSDLLVVLAKEPIANTVKTRLIDGYSIYPEDAAMIYKELLFNLIDSIISSFIPFALCVNSNGLMYFNKFFNDLPVIIYKGNETIGEKIDFIIKDYFKNHTGKLVITVSDVIYPTIDIIVKSFDLLDKNDVVIGKSDDGGFYLIGLKNVLDIWSEIEWSTPKVFGKLSENIIRGNLSFEVIEEVPEVDTIEDLQTLYHIYKGNNWFKNKYPFTWSTTLRLILCK